MPPGPYPSRTSGWGPDVKSGNWYVKFPADAYALGPVEFKGLATEAEVREWAKRWADVRRLPRGFQCWPA